jgi:hypothetical protein
MRTTLSIDDDVLAAAKGLAARQNNTVCEVVSALARQALRPAHVKQKRNAMAFPCWREPRAHLRSRSNS